MQNSLISWTRHTFNAWIGCKPKSEACRYCYAEAIARRWKRAEWGAGKPRVLTSQQNRKQPFKWNKQAERVGERHRVFALSMGDIFDPEVPLPWLADLLATVEATPNLDWLLLSKRPELAAKRLKEIGVWPSWPRPNIWLGASAENQRRADERIPILIDIPAHVHFLSCEPLLGHIDLQLDHIEWVITGGESGPQHRPMHPDWARSVRDQCLTAQIPFFFKQWGGKGNGGRILDGREWLEVPAVNLEGGNPISESTKALRCDSTNSRLARSRRGGSTEPETNLVR